MTQGDRASLGWLINSLKEHEHQLRRQAESLRRRGQPPPQMFGVPDPPPHHMRAVFDTLADVLDEAAGVVERKLNDVTVIRDEYDRARRAIP